MKRVIITGISGSIGRNLARLLHRNYEVHGIDRKPFKGKPKDVIMHHLDIRKKKVEDIFRLKNVIAVFHLAILHEPKIKGNEQHNFNMIGTNRVLDFVQKYKIPKIVILSSANLYGATNTNPIFFREDAPLMGGRDFYHIRDQIEVDMLAQSFFWKHADIDTIILRPVHVVGAGLHNAESSYLKMKYLPVLAGFDPMLQLIHEDDVVTAMQLCLKDGIKGVFNLAGPGAVPLSVVVNELRKKMLYIPHFIAGTLLNRLWKMGISSYPAPVSDHIKFSCMVDDKRARQTLGFKPAHSLASTIDAINEL